MLDWLRLAVMTFYAPGRALREVRDRAPLAQASVFALTTHVTFLFVLTSFFLPGLVDPRRALSVIMVFFQSAGCLVFLAVIAAPLMLLFLNMIEHRASLRLLMQQEYSATASALFFGWGAASLMTLILTIAGTLTGVLRAVGDDMFQEFLRNPPSMSPEARQSIEYLLNAQAFAGFLPLMIMLLVFSFWAVAAVKLVFRISGLKALTIVLLSAVVLIPGFVFLQPIFSMILGSPFLLLMLFLLFRNYFGELTRSQRARESFKQNLEAATLNPADSSAHYNLGLIHQQRGELEAARERFERAIQIDPEEIDAHYQLGRIARQQQRHADAIRNFEQVVSRDPAHAQSEIWREVGATYIAAGQFEDARNALTQFLDRRPSDPEALYLMGRAHAGLGHRSEAVSLMQACIDAVKTAPAYKYRADKRWLNEAQQFMKTGQ